mmetsp:Transcript_88822/g.153562  ORF Transcript_88822/g.153562 Transcript_88822/m.153562 type:complete len:389 (-) Transcript_88822:9-1175(-)
MAKRVGAIENRTLTAEEHHEWSLKLWNRMDRDGSGHIDKEELNCDEFQDVLQSIVAPKKGGGGRAVYGRAAQNIAQAIDFCLRKADQNNDGSLSFDEFKAFLRVLRNQSNDPDHSAKLIFALFDLDGSQTIDEEEFQEIYRYHLGKRPTVQEVKDHWYNLDIEMRGYVTREQYIRWLKTKAPKMFKQSQSITRVEEEAPPEEVAGTPTGDASPKSPPSGRTKRESPKKEMYKPAPGMMPRDPRRQTWSNSWHPVWNERFRGRDDTLVNPTLPRLQRAYFSRPASLPELQRFYNTYQGFGAQNRRLRTHTDPRRQKTVLSTDSQPQICPERAELGGTARNRHGDVVPWTDAWQTPLCEKQAAKKPGSLLLRCPGKPPPLLYLGRDAPEY